MGMDSFCRLGTKWLIDQGRVNLFIHLNFIHMFDGIHHERDGLSPHHSPSNMSRIATGSWMMSSLSVR